MDAAAVQQQRALLVHAACRALQVLPAAAAGDGLAQQQVARGFRVQGQRGAARQVQLALRGELVPLGKAAVVLTTAAGWYGGIVLSSDDWSFTVLNVLPHGVPYFALVWRDGARRGRGGRA